MRFKATIRGGEFQGECVNPGEWFGKAWVIECGIGYSSLYYAVEADHESDAIDELADSEEYGHIIRIDESDADEDTHRAGNAGEPVDLDNVAMYRPESIVYILDDGTELTPIEYANRED